LAGTKQKCEKSWKMLNVDPQNQAFTVAEAAVYVRIATFTHCDCR
jgi:hypothetical protein